jgi:hypothetical protein
MAAQNQHYVPRFILRQFLSDEEKEQVTVYDKHEDRVFVTSIKNIMTESRFNDFSNGEIEASFEPAASRIEEIVLPIYQQVLRERRIDPDPDVRANLALLVAFQLTRTKAHRTMRESIHKSLEDRTKAMGYKIEDIKGWEPFTEDVQKREHLKGVVESLDEFTRLISIKQFFLAKPETGRYFCIGDSPVTLTNRRSFGPYGNIGLAVPCIEIYMPLSSDLLLCAWCHTNAKKVYEHSASKNEFEQKALGELMAGRTTAAKMKAAMEIIRSEFLETQTLMSAFEGGAPIPSTIENMEHYDSLQSMYAHRYVIVKDGNFDTVVRHNREHAKFRKGFQPKFD